MIGFLFGVLVGFVVCLFLRGKWVLEIEWDKETREDEL